MKQFEIELLTLTRRSTRLLVNESSATQCREQIWLNAGNSVDPALLSRSVREVKTRRVRTISRKGHVQAASVSDDYLLGFIEGEGVFHVGIVPSQFTKL